MRNNALRIVVPGGNKPVDCLHNCTGPDAGKPDMITLTVRGVSADCLTGVKAALPGLILPDLSQVFPDEFALRKGVTFSVYTDDAFLSNGAVPFDPEGKDPLRSLVGVVTGKVLDVLASRSRLETANITVSFQ